MERPRWLVDEMLARLARYLRFVGLDVVQVRGLSDREILEQAEREDRRILTRDRQLAARSPRALLVRSPWLDEQWRELRAAWPGLPHVVSFERCSACNGPLAPYLPGTDPGREAGLPKGLVERGLAVFSCTICGHLYWEGSHTARIRGQLSRWEAETGSR